MIQRYARRQTFKFSDPTLCQKAEIQGSMFIVHCSAKRQKFKFSDSMLCQKAENARFSDSKFKVS